MRAETGKSHAEIAELAASEGLYGITFPRRPSVSTVQDWCNREVTPEGIRRRLLIALDAQITLELAQREGERAVSFIRQCMGALDQKQAKQNRAGQTPQEEGTPTEEQLRSESLERLAAAHKAESKNGAAQTNPTPIRTDGGSTGPTAHAATDTGQSENGSDGRAIADASGPAATREPVTSGHPPA